MNWGAAAVHAGCIAQSVNDAEDTWQQIGANWAVSRTLLAHFEKEAAR